MSRGLFLSFGEGGGSGVLPREKFDFRDGWRTILSLFHGRKFVFFQEIFIWNVHVSFTLRTCVACVMGVTPLNSYSCRIIGHIGTYFTVQNDTHFNDLTATVTLVTISRHDRSKSNYAKCFRNFYFSQSA